MASDSQLKDFSFCLSSDLKTNANIFMYSLKFIIYSQKIDGLTSEKYRFSQVTMTIQPWANNKPCMIPVQTNFKTVDGQRCV